MSQGQAAPLLDAMAVAKAYGPTPLFADVNLTLGEGARLGIIGANGAGKSTLLGLLDGSVVADAGQIVCRRGLRIERLAQAPNFGAQSAYDVLAQALAPQRAALAAFEANSGGANAATLQREVERLGGYTWQHRLERVASELMLGELSRPCAALSGGYNKRLALARLRLCEADLLLLDEPTNHLDLACVQWLERWLQKARQAVVVITHDRAFLDAVATTMAELRCGRLTQYVGNYSDYLVASAERDALEARGEHRSRRHLQHELGWAARSPQARTSKNRARLARIEAALERLGGPREPPKLQPMQLGTAPRLGGEVLALDQVVARHGGGPPLFAPVNLRLCAGERWGIVGANGAGKTSLLNIVAGRILPAQGRVSRGKNTQVGYYDQLRTTLDPNQSVTDALLGGGGDSITVDGASMHVNAYLERFGLGNDLRQRRVAELSGGEQSRLALALFLRAPANLLLLDEPTNDLDLTTLAVLERALLSFSGCMLIVSHDRTFLNRVATGIVALHAGASGPAQVDVVQGNYDHYLRWAAQRRSQAAPRDPQALRGGAVPAAAPPPARKAKLTLPERHELAALEAHIEAAEAAYARDEAKLSCATLWQGSAEAGRALQAQLEQDQQALQRAYARWGALIAKQEP